jgi:hypothetical protein
VAYSLRPRIFLSQKELRFQGAVLQQISTTDDGFSFFLSSGRQFVFMGYFTDLAWEWEWFQFTIMAEFSETCHGSYSFWEMLLPPFFFSFEI